MSRRLGFASAFSWSSILPAALLVWAPVSAALPLALIGAAGPALANEEGENRGPGQGGEKGGGGEVDVVDPAQIPRLGWARFRILVNDHRKAHSGKVPAIRGFSPGMSGRLVSMLLFDFRFTAGLMRRLDAEKDLKKRQEIMKEALADLSERARRLSESAERLKQRVDAETNRDVKAQLGEEYMNTLQSIGRYGVMIEHITVWSNYPVEGTLP